MNDIRTPRSVKKHLPMVLDGGHSNELEKLGFNFKGDLWTADLIESNPQAVIQVHSNYLYAGAQIITTMSYQATIPRYLTLGYSREKAESLILKSVELAEEARSAYCKERSPETRPLIAASIGPYGAYLADGSEYSGHYGISDKELWNFHYRKIKILDESNADVLFFETVPSYREMLVLEKIMQSMSKPAWISFSCKNEELIHDGTPLRDCALVLNESDAFEGVGVNCTPPRFISSLLRTLNAILDDKKILIYPNSGDIYDGEKKSWIHKPNEPDLCDYVNEWLGTGVDIIGGCCRVGPTEIQRISTMVNDHSKTQ